MLLLIQDTVWFPVKDSFSRTDKETIREENVLILV